MYYRAGGDLRKVTAVDLVVGLDEDLAQLGLAEGVVLEVKLVEAREGGGVWRACSDAV